MAKLHDPNEELSGQKAVRSLTARDSRRLNTADTIQAVGGREQDKEKSLPKSRTGTNKI